MEPWMMDALAVLFGVGLVLASGLLIVFWADISSWLHAHRELLAPLAVFVAAGLLGGSTAGLVGALLGIVGAGLLLAAWRSSVNRSAEAGEDYVTHEDEGGAARAVISPVRKAENGISAETETPRNAAPPLDINLLRHEARAAALGALLAHGLVVQGKRTEAMRAVFGKVSGDAYTRAGNAVKRHEQQVLATLPPVEEVEPEAPRLIPIQDGKGGYIEA